MVCYTINIIIPNGIWNNLEKQSTKSIALQE